VRAHRRNPNCDILAQHAKAGAGVVARAAQKSGADSPYHLAPVRGGGRWYQNGGPPFASLSPRLSLSIDHPRTVLAVKGSLRRAQQRRALDRSGPF
jgi:hypothetical protein